MSGPEGGRAPVVSVVIATAYRNATLTATLRSLAVQTRPPEEIVVVDCAPAPGAEPAIDDFRHESRRAVVYRRSSRPSAAAQRNLGIEAARGAIIIFLDDDAYPEPDCFERIVRVFEEDDTSRIGGVSVLIRNQLCPRPSSLAKRWFDFLADEPRASYAGMVIGPAVAIGPEPTSHQGPVPAEWLMTGCAAYRRDALPPGGFNPRFFGYSYMEDVDLSLRVRRRYDLVVHTGAYIFHDSQPSRFKAPYVRAKMVAQNRYFVMTATLGRTSFSHHVRFVASLVVPLLTSLRDVRAPRDLVDWLRSCAGTASGLMTTGMAALKHGVDTTEVRASF